MAKDGSGIEKRLEAVMPKDAPPNRDAPADEHDPAGDVPEGPRRRVSEMQAKLHRWAAADPGRRFDDLFNLVHDPATLIVAWDRVATNRGANTAGSDGWTVTRIEQTVGRSAFLDDLRARIKGGEFRPEPVRERKIPKPGGSGKVRRLGIPTVTDRVVQAALKLVLEPIFEADFEPVSYGFRPKRRAHDAIAEIHHFGTQGYQWVLDADIEACFDSIDHTALMDRVRSRVKDKRVLRLVKAFLKAGILTELGDVQDTDTGTPQGGILSPLLANIALSVLDEHLHAPWKPGGTTGTAWQRRSRRGKDLPNWRLVRYADDFVVLTDGPAQPPPAGTARTGRFCACSTGFAPFRRQDPDRAHERGVRLPRLPHPVETQEGHQQVVRLHLHRRPAVPVGEGQDPCPDPQDVTARTQGRVDPDQPDHSRLGQLLQARRRETHLQPTPALHLVADRADDADPAPLEVEGRPSLAHRPHRPVAPHQRGRDRTVQPRNDTHHQVPLPGQQDPQPLGPSCLNQPTAETMESPLR